MINNPLLLLSLFNSATNLAGNLLEGAAEAIGLTDGNGKSLQGDFSEFLTKAGTGEIGGEISQEIADLINAPQTEEEISSFLTEQLSTADLDQQTRATIEQILGGANLVNLEGDRNASTNQNITEIEGEAALLQSAQLKQQSSEKVIINEDKILDRKDVTLKQEFIKVDDKFVNPLAKNLGLKEDERILGKDNLQSFGRGVDKDISFRNNEILGLNNELVGRQVNVKNGAGESLTDLKLADATKEQLLQQNSYNSTVRSEADQLARQDHFAKAAHNSRPTQQTTYTQAEGNGYKIANVTKTENGIELKLEPISLGKVHIKLDFNAEGKSIVAVFVEKADTLDLLKSDARGLEKILSENGLSADSNSLSFNLQQQNGNNNGQGFFNLSSGRNIAFNMEQELNDNVKDVSISNTNALYRDLNGVGMLDMVV